MNDVTVTITFDKIRVALEKAADEVFKSSYNNPIVELLNKCLKDHEGEVKKVVDSIIVESISSPDFKAKMADVIIQKMVEGALKK